jgi:hypothetical protein
MIELTIFEKASKKNLVIYIVIGILTFFALYLLFPSYGPLVFFVPLILFLIIISVTEAKEKPAGTIFLTDKQILIKTNRTDIASELSGIRKLELKYSGFKGKRLPADYFPRFNRFSGNDNYILIELGSEVYKFRFLVEDEVKENQIVELVGDWEKTGFNVSNISLNI